MSFLFSSFSYELVIKKINDQYNFWSTVNSIQGNVLGNELVRIQEMQMKVCGLINDMKTTWEEVANSQNFNTGFDDTLMNQTQILNELQRNVSSFVAPYQIAEEFLSWTFTQMSSIKNDSDLSPYPSNGYNDIVLLEYLKSGAVIIMNFDLWINKTDSVNYDLQRKRIIGNSFETKFCHKAINHFTFSSFTCLKFHLSIQRLL